MRPRIAFAPQTPDRLRHRILALLAGVGHPMASAILTVWRPDEHTVLDYRVVAALQELGNRGVLNSDAPGGSEQALPGYWAYLQAYRPIADKIGANYRDLDRALWKWHKAGMPDTWLGMRPDSATAVPDHPWLITWTCPWPFRCGSTLRRPPRRAKGDRDPRSIPHNGADNLGEIGLAHDSSACHDDRAEWEERLRRAETALAEDVREFPEAAGSPEVRGAALAASAVGVAVPRIAGIAGVTEADVEGWLARYRDYEASFTGYPG